MNGFKLLSLFSKTIKLLDEYSSAIQTIFIILTFFGVNGFFINPTKPENSCKKGDEIQIEIISNINISNIEIFE